MNSNELREPSASPLRLDATTRIQRNVAAYEVSNAIAQVGGVVLDHHAYSNIALAVHFSLTRRDMPRLADHLRSCGMLLSSKSESLLRGPSGPPEIPGDTTEVPCSLHLRFVHDEPDLRRKVLPVPG